MKWIALLMGLALTSVLVGCVMKSDTTYYGWQCNDFCIERDLGSVKLFAITSTTISCECEKDSGYTITR